MLQNDHFTNAIIQKKKKKTKLVNNYVGYTKKNNKMIKVKHHSLYILIEWFVDIS